MPLPSLHFDYTPYPLWRRKSLLPVGALARPLLRRWLSVDADVHPPETPDAMAGYLARWGLLGGLNEAAARAALESDSTPIEAVSDAAPQPYRGGAVRLPAQWEPMEAVIVSWPVLYPPLWELHAQMVEAISEVADVHILVPLPMWGQAARLFLNQRGMAEMTRVRFLHLPTDDIWVRDYGPFVGLDANGDQVAVDAIFDPLPNYPQARDNAMPGRWAAHHEIPAYKLDLHTEGGNVWSDGAGTLLMTDDIMHRHANIGRDEVLRRLHGAFDFEKLVLLPPLALEETSHVDLLTKLSDAQTVLIAAPTNRVNRGRLRAAAERLRGETNARGEPYRLIELPMPPLVMNWGVFPVWRAYTNALTVNGRVLVPVFGVPSDAEALETYRRAMSGYEIIPIECSVSANGGGAVHCLTKEVPGGKRG